MFLSWKEVLGFSVTAGVVTWLLSTAFAVGRESLDKRKNSRYHALRVALALEHFAMDCARAISDYADWDASQGSVGSPLPKLPELALGEEVDWKTLHTALVEQILSLPNQVKHANGSIDFMWQVTSPDDDVTEGPEQAGLLGYQAVTLAKRLRGRYKLPPAPQKMNRWDYVDVLRERHNEKIASWERRG
jgi:hypothetical protein